MARNRQPPTSEPRVFLPYDSRSWFFWRTTLSPERQDAIIAWVNSLGNSERSLLNDLLNDTREFVEWDCEEQHSQ